MSTVTIRQDLGNDLIPGSPLDSSIVYYSRRQIDGATHLLTIGEGFSYLRLATGEVISVYSIDLDFHEEGNHPA